MYGTCGLRILNLLGTTQAREANGQAKTARQPGSAQTESGQAIGRSNAFALSRKRGIGCAQRAKTKGLTRWERGDDADVSRIGCFVGGGPPIFGWNISSRCQWRRDNGIFPSLLSSAPRQCCTLQHRRRPAAQIRCSTSTRANSQQCSKSITAAHEMRRHERVQPCDISAELPAPVF